MAHGLLVSQIGYDLFDPMRALYRSDERSQLSDAARFAIIDQVGESSVQEGSALYWREKEKL